MEFDAVISKRARPRSPKPIAPRSTSPPPFSAELNLDQLKLSQLDNKLAFRKFSGRPQTAAVPLKPSWKIRKSVRSPLKSLEAGWKVPDCIKRPKSAISLKHYAEGKPDRQQFVSKSKSVMKRMLNNQIYQLSDEMSRIHGSTKKLGNKLLTNEVCKQKAANLAEEYRERRKILKTYNAVLELHLKRVGVDDIKQSVENLRNRKEEVLSKAEKVILQKGQLQTSIDALNKERETIFQEDVNSLESLKEKDDFKQKFKQNSKLLTEIKLLEQKIGDCKSQQSNLCCALSKSYFRIQKAEILKQIRNLQKKVLFSSDKAIVELEEEVKIKEEYSFNLNDKSSVEKLKKIISKEALINNTLSDYSKINHRLESHRKDVEVALSYLCCVEIDINAYSSFFSNETWKAAGNRYKNELENLKDRFKTMDIQLHAYNHPDEVADLKEIVVIKRESLKEMLQEMNMKLRQEECYQLRLTVQLNNNVIYKDILELERLIDEVVKENEDVLKKMKENRVPGLAVEEVYEEIHQMALFKNVFLKNKLRKNDKFVVSEIRI